MAYYKTQNNVVIEAERYQKGVEDGFIKGDNSLCIFCKDSCQGCYNYMPYINTTHGKQVIHANDYIVYDYTGRRNVVSKLLFDQVFTK